MDGVIQIFLVFGVSALLFLHGYGFKTILAALETRLHPKEAEMALYAIKAYLDSNEGRQASANEQRDEVLRIVARRSA